MVGIGQFALRHRTFPIWTELVNRVQTVEDYRDILTFVPNLNYGRRLTVQKFTEDVCIKLPHLKEEILHIYIDWLENGENH
jgi:hypothetical protein